MATSAPLEMRVLRWIACMLLPMLFLASPARAADYPPKTAGDGTVSSSTVEPGSCITFSGGGFEPGTSVAIADNGKPSGTTKANPDGTFTYDACFDSSAESGQHQLTGSGRGANGAARVVTARVLVVGAQVSAVNGGSAGGGGGGGLPFTGSDTRDLVLFAIALIVSGGLLAHRGRTARALRRASRVAG